MVKDHACLKREAVLRDWKWQGRGIAWDYYRSVVKKSQRLEQEKSSQTPVEACIYINFATDYR